MLEQVHSRLRAQFVQEAGLGDTTRLGREAARVEEQRLVRLFDELFREGTCVYRGCAVAMIMATIIITITRTTAYVRRRRLSIPA